MDFNIWAILAFVIIFGDVGLMKPERRIYELAAEHLGISLEEAEK